MVDIHGYDGWYEKYDFPRGESRYVGRRRPGFKTHDTTVWIWRGASSSPYYRDQGKETSVREEPLQVDKGTKTEIGDLSTKI